VVAFDPPLHLFERVSFAAPAANLGQAGDAGPDEKYRRAADFLRRWVHQGVLIQEHEDSLYAYHQVFDWEGRHYTRRGFLGRIRLERFGEGKVFPHEQTFGGPKEDRLKLLRATHLNASPVYLLYRDKDRQIRFALDDLVMEEPQAGFATEDGQRHAVWVINDPDVIEHLQAAFDAEALYIADGHHRYETACTLRDNLAAELAQRDETLPSDLPANYVLMMCVSMSDPGMLVLATHRLFRGLAPLSSQELQQRLGDAFAIERAGSGPDRARSLWEEIEVEGNQATFGLYTAKDDMWTIAGLTDVGRRRMAEVAPLTTSPKLILVRSALVRNSARAAVKSPHTSDFPSSSTVCSFAYSAASVPSSRW
jgi:uncharacterized protein (DUF1015 family)